MSAYRIIEAINIFANSFDRITACLEYSAPDQLRLDCLEDGFHHRIIIAISFVVHGWKHFVSCGNSAVLITGILAAPVGVLDQPRLWLPDSNGFLQSSYGQVLLHPIPRFSADNTTRVKIDNDCQIKPAFCGPYVADVDTPFLIWSVTAKVLIQKIGSDRLTVIAVGRALETRLLSGFQTIVSHQSHRAVTSWRPNRSPVVVDELLLTPAEHVGLIVSFDKPEMAMLTTLEYECGWMGPGKPDETDITLLTAHVSDGPAGAIPPLPAKPRTIEALGEPVVPRRFVLTESMGGMDHNNMSTSSDSMAMKSQIIEHEKDGRSPGQPIVHGRIP